MANEKDTFHSRAQVRLGDGDYEIFRLDALERAGVGDLATLPFSLKVLLENLLRHEDGETVTADDIQALAAWDPGAEPATEVAYRPARVLLQDFTGVPSVVDLAAMRDAMVALGGDPTAINPLSPADLVIDHSVQVDVSGSPQAFGKNVAKEYQRNRERYQFLRWGQQAFENLRVVPPDTGIVHQVNLEYLASVVTARAHGQTMRAFPDSLVGTDSHTTMINGLGVFGWGVGGIEAEAAMLGQPISMLIPQVVGVRLSGTLPGGATATDLVLTITEVLRKTGVVGKFVEFFGPGLSSLSLTDRATIANMSPEYGATMGFFPIDRETLAYLAFSGRDPDAVARVERYAAEQGLLSGTDGPEPRFSKVVDVRLGDVVPSIAGPKRPQDRIPLVKAKPEWRKILCGLTGIDDGAAQKWAAQTAEPAGKLADTAIAKLDGGDVRIGHGHVVIAAITSCTNTSNPQVMLAAGLLAQRAVARGLSTKPWVKTSLAPGSQVVTEYFEAAGVDKALDALGFDLVGYGCTTCIGNSGPVDPAIAAAVGEADLVVASVLSGNRNFEGRINPVVRANFLASPPLVVAYAIAGTLDIDFETDPLGTDKDGNEVFLRDLWPSPEEITETVRKSVRSDMFKERYGHVFEGTEEWRKLAIPTGNIYDWNDSTYIRKPTFFDGMGPEPEPMTDISGARVLAMLGDSVTTDHISPAGQIAKDSPAARYLESKGVAPADFNQYGTRRGNHEVMMRGTFANIRLRNLLAPGTEGGVTRHLPDGEVMSIFDASVAYAAEGVPLVVLAGKEYGSGSSRDWAAKGTLLLGVRAVIADSYERIHRSNLIGMGVLPLEYLPGQTAASLGLTGEEVFAITGLGGGISPKKRLTVTATPAGGSPKTFEVIARIDTPQEVEYLRHGGILQYVLRSRL
ncbi:MAG TPA: aconitate hydratase AcnA [Kofleriaceae bacterium]|nr:aconitate hydratase AcnA [Kofleriaceae bacterium]